MSKHRNGSVINAKKGKLRAIAYLSEDGSIYEADKKENKQLKFIQQYAKAHGIMIVNIIRRNAMGPMIMNKQIQNVVESIKKAMQMQLLLRRLQRYPVTALMHIQK